MKRISTVFLTVSLIFILISCEEPLLSGPRIPNDGGVTNREVAAPGGLKASQGEKRSVTLSWNLDPNAVMYYIYQAESPLKTFARCGETTAIEFKFNVSPGTTFYYRVSSVSYDGTESAQSAYVRGTSLAQPVISDITDITESAAAVTWYMENVFEDSYKEDLLYTVYCFNGSSEFAQIALDGSVISENRAVFNGLAPNTRYEYQVEAYLRGDQNASEKSDKMDAATARRFRPGAPINLTASRGSAVDRITLSFELPDMVDIALGENLYDPKPLYFVISKRFYSASGNNDYQKVCSYFGSIAGKGDLFPGGYAPGSTVTWSDTNVTRGVKYEYLVQSYVDDTLKIISSDSSKTSATGWALSEGTLLFGNVSYTGTADLNTSATLPLDFEFDPRDEPYGYTLIEKIEPLGDDYGYDPDGTINRELTFNTYNAVRAHVPRMDLTRKTTYENPGRGIYSYSVEIRQNGVLLDTVSTIGKKEVSEDTNPIIVDNFRVQDGYTNKFVFKWDYCSNRKYTLYEVEKDGKVIKEIGSVNDSPSTEADVDKNYSHTYTAGDIVPGVTRYFAIKPSRDMGGGSFKSGQMEYATSASQTLGVPNLSLGAGIAYSSITASWTEAQKADTYRVKYRYTGETAYKTAATVKKEALSVDASGKFKYTFKPEGNEIDIAKAGKEIQIQVDALNEGLRSAAGGDEISTSSKEDIRTRLLGPSELGLSVSRGASALDINVSWNKITGADGYYVFRRQFNINNTAQEGTESVVYYVPAFESDIGDITGKNLLLDSTNAKTDTTTVKAAVTFAGSRYTLRDICMADNEYEGSFFIRHTPTYRDQQNNIAHGYPFRYWVVPVVSGASLNSIDFEYNKDSGNKNADIAYYTIQENGAVKFLGAGAVEKNAGTGFTIGFGQNVTATKGTYTSSGNVNNGIKITWSQPPLLDSVPGFSPRYTVYRRESGGSSWETLTTNLTVSEYIENPSGRGVAYEYAVGITNGNQAGDNSDPRAAARFIDECYKQLDDKGRPKMLGFMLDMVKMESVSRNEQKVGNNFAEEVKWKSAGIKHRSGVGNKWGIDGYEVWVMNRNIDADWHKITEIPYANIPDQIDQSVKVTNESDLLKVMRDYRHFFKIRSYVLSDSNERIYSPDPPYTYKYYWKDNERYLFENDYVKWGARQITPLEFGRIAMVYMCDGIDQVNGTAWNTAYDGFPLYGDREKNADGDGTSGKVHVKSNFAVSEWTFTFTNYKTDMQVRTGEWQHFVTINGKTWAGTSASNQYPQRWGYMTGPISVIGPTDTPGLYTGEITLGGGRTGYADLYWGSGDVSVKYPAGTAEQKIISRGEDTPMLFSGRGDRRYQQDAWK